MNYYSHFSSYHSLNKNYSTGNNGNNNCIENIVTHSADACITALSYSGEESCVFASGDNMGVICIWQVLDENTESWGENCENRWGDCDDKINNNDKNNNGFNGIHNVSADNHDNSNNNNGNNNTNNKYNNNSFNNNICRQVRLAAKPLQIGGKNSINEIIIIVFIITIITTRIIFIE